MNFKRIIVLLVAALMIGLLFWYSATLHEAFFKTVDFFHPYFNKMPVLGGIIFTSLAATSAMLAAFSSAPLVPVAVLWWGEDVSFTLLFLGWIIGGSLAYAVGWYAGNPLFQRFLVFQKVASYKQHLPKKTSFGLVLLFRLAMPAEVSGYVLGTLRYNFFLYLIATMLAELPFALMIVYASNALLKQEPIIYTGIALTGVAAIVVFLYSFQRAIAEYKKRKA